MITRKYIDEQGLEQGDDIRLTVKDGNGIEHRFNAKYYGVFEKYNGAESICYSIPQRKTSPFCLGGEIGFQRDLEKLMGVEKV